MKLKVNGYYGELADPYSMVYEQEGEEVLHVTINEAYDNDTMSNLLIEIDQVIRKYMEVH